MANTPFLNLVKPTDTDQALITDINNNSDKIDTGVSTLSEQIATYEIPTNTIANIEAALATYASGLTNNEIRTVKFTVSPATTMFAATSYIGTIRRVATGRYNILVQGFLEESGVIIGNYRNSTWTWKQLAITPVVAYTETAFSVNTNSFGVAAVPSASIPTVSGRTRVMLVLANFTSSELSASQIPPTVVETSSGNVFILGSPSKTYSGLQLKGLFI